MLRLTHTSLGWAWAGWQWQAGKSVGNHVLVKQQNAGSNLRIGPWPTLLEGGGDLVQTDTCTRSMCPPPGGRIYAQAYTGPMPVPVTPCLGPAALSPPPQSVAASPPPSTEAGGEGGRDLQLSAASDSEGTVVQLYIPGLNKLETFLVIALVAVVVLLTCGCVLCGAVRCVECFMMVLVKTWNPRALFEST